MSQRWERIEYFDKHGAGKMVVTIQSSGRISFNIGLREAFLKNVEHIELFYNKEESLIGMKPTNNKTAHGLFPINDAKWGQYLPARFFLSKYGLKPDRAVRYQASWDEPQQMIVVNLKNPLPTRRKVDTTDV